MKVKPRPGKRLCSICRDMVDYKNLNRETSSGRGARTFICDRCWNKGVQRGWYKGKLVGTENT